MKIIKTYKEYLFEQKGDGDITTYGDVICKKEGKILLLKRSSESKLEPNKWAFPGGHVMPGETTEEGSLRECYEECGVKVNQIKFLDEYKNPDGSISNYFSGNAINEVDEEAVQTESDDYAWIIPSDIRKYDIIFGNYDRFNELIQKI